jgi:two-component system cell cycle sensor histidine kinase/response regulator CckA
VFSHSAAAEGRRRSVPQEPKRSILFRNGNHRAPHPALLMAGILEEPSQIASIERLVLEQLPMAVVATDVNGIVTRWTNFSESLFGWTAGEAVGQDLLDLLIDTPDRQAAESILARAQAGQASDGEFPVLRKDGTRLLCRLSQSPLHEDVGDLAGIAWVLMDITRSKEADRRLAARTAVTRVLAEAGSLEDAAPKVLHAVCQSLGWNLGALWRVDEAANCLYCVDLWTAPKLKDSEFEALSRNTTFEPGVGLPGRVWASGEPAWIPDVVQDRNFPRARVAALGQLHGGFGFPIVLGGAVLGVIEFFSDEVREPDAQLLQTMGVIASQIGQFIQRKEAETELRSSR